VNRPAHELSAPITVRSLGLQDYEPLWRAMQRFTDTRTPDTADEIWFTEHPPVFTLGLNASREHLLETGNIPVVQIDRGGQVTYHGPGMLMVYPLIDLKRLGLGVRDLVTALEQSVVDLATVYGIEARAKPDAPGVYVADTKFASVGLRIRRGASYHGMALNVRVDLEPFLRINPCGYAGLEMTDLATLGGDSNLDTVQQKLLPHFLKHLRLEDANVISGPTGL
jgi:lipoyl(octanoyl) transferase